jgi:hypothetical protein
MAMKRRDKRQEQVGGGEDEMRVNRTGHHHCRYCGHQVHDEAVRLIAAGKTDQQVEDALCLVLTLGIRKEFADIRADFAVSAVDAQLRASR